MWEINRTKKRKKGSDEVRTSNEISYNGMGHTHDDKDSRGENERRQVTENRARMRKE